MKNLVVVAALFIAAFSLRAQTTVTVGPQHSYSIIATDGAGVSPVVTATQRGWVPLGYAKYTPSTVKSLSSACAGTACVTLPATATHAIIQVSTNPIRMRSDGTNPTATEGVPIAAETTLIISNSPAWLAALKFIDTAAGASEVNVAYFKSVGE